MSRVRIRLDQLRSTPGLPAWIVKREVDWRRQALLVLVNLDLENTFSDQKLPDEIAAELFVRIRFNIELGNPPGTKLEDMIRFRPKDDDDDDWPMT